MWAQYMLICVCHMDSYLLTYILNLSQHYDRDVDLMCNSSFAYFYACCNSPTRACKIVSASVLFYFIVDIHIQGGSKKSKLLYCDRYFNGQTIVLALNILAFCEQSRTGKLATVIIFPWLNILCCTTVTSCFVTVQLTIIFQIVIMGKISKEDKILMKKIED